MNEKLELRMYGLVPYNISPIQKAIQFGHAVVEYGQLVKLTQPIPPMRSNALETYNDWADNYKTFIILDGGTSNHTQNRYSDVEYVGTMENNLKSLQDNSVDLATFYEPDLNDMLSSIVFIVDERVFNKKDYPDFEEWFIEKYTTKIDGVEYNPLKDDEGLSILKKTTLTKARLLAKNIKEKEKNNEAYQIWLKSIGGETNAFLKDFLKNFRLA